MGRKAADLTNLKFGRWLVLYRTNTCKPAMWMCRCDCGTERAVWDADMKRGYSASCGCHRRETFIAANTTHGMTGSQEYSSWLHMRRRCENPEDDGYQAYGGRGIKVCQRWLEDFSTFYADMGPAPGPNYSVDRIKNELGYEPGNCKWSTPVEQSNNRRDVPLYDYHGTPKTIRQAINQSKTGICIQTVKFRMRKGWDIVRAVDTPVDRRKSRRQVRGGVA